MKRLIYLLVISVAITSCMSNEKPGGDLTASNSKRMKEFYDQVMNSHNPAMVDSFCTPDFLDHQASPGYAPGAEGLRTSFKDFFSAYPDLNVKVNFVQAWGDTVMAQFTMTGTNTGPMMGMQPTGKQINIDGVDIVVIKDGKARERWGFQEEMKMMNQLGLMGGPPAADSTKK